MAPGAVSAKGYKTGQDVALFLSSKKFEDSIVCQDKFYYDRWADVQYFNLK